MAGVFRATRTPTKGASTPLLRWTYWREYTASEPAYRTYAEGGEIDSLKVQLVYKKRKQEGLWWWANCSAGISSKASIRHHYTRLLRRAFEDALRESGYAKDGPRLVKEDGKEGLTGSLQILGMAKVADERWVNVKEECSRVVDEVVKLHRRPLRTPGSGRLQSRQQKPPADKGRPGFRRGRPHPVSSTDASSPATSW